MEVTERAVPAQQGSRMVQDPAHVSLRGSITDIVRPGDGIIDWTIQ
jgi:hypothetical protein